MVAVANVVADHRTLHHDIAVSVRRTASLAFGQPAVDAAIRHVQTTLRTWEVSEHTSGSQVAAALSDLMLCGGTATLSDLTDDLFTALADVYGSGARRTGLIKVSRVLAHEGILREPVARNTRQRGPRRETLESAPAAWVQWALRWRHVTTIEPGSLRGRFAIILIAGRWAADKHPEAVEPHLWTRDIAAEYVADTLNATHGQWAGCNRDTRNAGQPLGVKGKVQRIDGLRAFFLDLIDWEWITPRFDPRKALAGPLSVRAQLGPNPRIIDDASWAKLMAAGLTVQASDLKRYGSAAARAVNPEHRTYYPIEMVRALIGVWLFAGLRVDEIRRLELDCVRREEGRDDTTGTPFPICLLHVPANKTSRAFSKPVDPLVGELIDAWQAIRPPQPDLVDRKTRQRRQFLFCVRSELVGLSYLNSHLIPVLCRKAGIPEHDSRGALTSHRARATIATQLLNAPEPLSLVDLKEWLGHKHYASTRHYATILQRRLTAAYKKADYFARNVRTIQVLIDRETIMTGAAADGETWKYYDLGDGYCTYDFFAKCPHRLACARCPFYLPKQSSAGQLLAVRSGVERMLEQLALTDDERSALLGDRDSLTQLAQRLSKIPTPAGPTPEELGTASSAFIALDELRNSLPGHLAGKSVRGEI
ncbi:tyrosine-type recombinase/integrase [Mycolicibacterium sp. S3B2]|uniref:tyrosine-type recombinase/integrase n=1 Tax=Mycolicibacterium sp. S3B2 TaxID=3415120 RepID=UPI003C7AA566